MANNGNEIIDSDTNCAKQTDCFVYCNVPNASNEGSSTENHKFFHKILKYLRRSTVRMIQSKKKKCNVRERSTSTPCKSEEKITTCTSLSSIADNIIKSDAETVTKMKQKMIDAITSTTRSGEALNKVIHKNLSGVVGHFVLGASYRCAEYTAKYADNAMPKRCCGPICIDIGTQSDTVDGEFGLKTSHAVFAKACEERRHADFILEEIAKVSDSLTKKARLVSAKEQAATILASGSVTSTRYELREETVEHTEPLISSINAEEKPPAVAAAAVTVMQPETLTDSQVLASSLSHFAPDSRQNFSASLDESLSKPDIQIIPSIKHLKDSELTHEVTAMYPERDDFQDTAVTIVPRKREKKEKESPKKIPLRQTLDKRIDKTNNAAVKSVIINSIPKLRKNNFKSLDLYQPNDTQTDARLTSRRKPTTKMVKNDIIDSSVKTSQIKKESTQIAKDGFQESVSLRYKKPKYRTKYRINSSYMIKEERVPQFKIPKEIPKDSDKLPKYRCLSFPSSKTIRSSKSFDYFERPAMEMYQDCRSKPLRYLQPIRHCEDLIPSKIYPGKTKYCDVCTIPCFSSQNEATRNVTISHSHCRPPQDSCATEYLASCCHSLVDRHVSSRHCNINDCAKRRVTFENSLCTNMYCKNDVKYCYPHLNNIDNVRMGYYHCNDSCPIWNNNQHCDRDRSYYWTKGNLYFMHPWTSEHLLRYN